ncbi:unnamed protein product [Rotaria sp. Silwood1]|nr:unnamed protein product [Rotaria sp. Silwood1]CAF1487778.1 unnamed protein product [Rotaria sp. Silwood1]CAF3679475.1 unnamed protein product [Rotaria sp. Silwood1]CAF3692441.1 unnamed protein product [Rotaria sp. Silwood1]CAF4836674.1 unnamed protein product [Rotaria sp. Silwood1]
MSLFIFGLLLCFPAIYCADPSFLAVFFTEDTKSLLKDKFFRSHEYSSPFYGNTRHIYCDHSTIEFNPRSDSINKYKAHYGHVQKLTILAYAEDEHAQAILVHCADGNDTHPSMNKYPHVTISVSNVKPYTPVYSNDLWTRFVDDRIVEIQVDEYDKPRSITIKDHISEWYGKLSSNGEYEETKAYVKIMNEIIDLDGIVCVNNLWKNDECQKF